MMNKAKNDSLKEKRKFFRDLVVSGSAFCKNVPRNNIIEGHCLRAIASGPC
jgi:hypothetical protein